MIVRKHPTHYEVEMFHNVVLNIDNPKESWLRYIADITKELEHEVTRTQYPALGLAPITGHIVVPGKDEGEKGILDAINKKYNHV